MQQNGAVQEDTSEVERDCGDDAWLELTLDPHFLKRLHDIKPFVVHAPPGVSELGFHVPLGEMPGGRWEAECKIHPLLHLLLPPP